MNRILGLDVGTKRIGVAVSDPLGFTAQGLKTIERIGIKKDMAAIGQILEEYHVQKVVVGMPKNMNNTIGPSGEMAQKIGEKMKNKFNIEVIYVDERLSSVSAERVLIQGDVRRENRKKHVDRIAATFILQTYLDSI